MPRISDFKDDEVHPTKGPKGDTAFLKDNYKLMGIGCSFRTVKARFSPGQIQDAARKAGYEIEIIDETPWLKVKIVGKARPQSRSKPKSKPSDSEDLKDPGFYTGAGKQYPKTDEIDIFS